MQRLGSLITHIEALRGIAGFLLAFGLGALGVFGHAPLHIAPAFFVSIVGLYLLLDGARTRDNPLAAGFKVAWTWAFGYFLAGMFWVGNAFLVDAEKFALLMPFAVTALPAFLALFWGLAGFAYARFSHGGIQGILIFVIAISAAEFARGHLFTGLPWNLPAYIWTPGGIVSQSAAIIGPYGLTALTLWVFVAPLALLNWKGRPSAPQAAWLLSIVVITSTVVSFGAMRLHTAGPLNPSAGNGPVISAGQGGFSQKEVWDRANAMRVTQTYIDLLNDPASRNSDIIIWPEGAFPFLLLEQPDVLQAIADRLASRTLVVGSVVRETGANADVYRNSALAFDTAAGALGLRAQYNKHHLVPFGEYLPLRPIFQAMGIASLVAYEGEMTPSAAPGLMQIGKAPLADPRVCYEIVFPSFNRAARTKAGWILNVSIDAWYGDLLGPDQHYAQARFRAIETGMPLVRAASGGWSAIVDRYGRPLAEHRYGAGYATAKLPTDARETAYARFADTLFWGFLGLFSVFCVFLREKGVDKPE